MHSSQIILALTLIATAAPAIAAPLPAPGTKSDNAKFARAFTEEAGLQARAPISFGPLGKELLKGLAGGAGLSAVFGGISALTGGNKQRRELGDNLTQEEADQLERELEGMMKDNSLQAREPISFGPLGKELLKGLAGGAGLSAVFGGISALTGGNNQKRELDERGIGSIIGKLVGATDDALGTVVKNGAISGAAFGATSSVSGGILDKIFGRELEAREPISFGPLGKELLKGLAGGAGLSAVFGGISALTGGNNQRRELGDNLTQEEADELERELEAAMNGNSLSRRQGVAGAVAKSGLGSLIGKAIVGGLGSAIGGFGVDQIINKLKGRDVAELTQEEADELEHQLQALMDADKSLSRRQGVAGAVAKSGLGSLIGKAIVGGLGSAIGGFGVDQIINKLKGRDIADLTQEEADELEREFEAAMNGNSLSRRQGVAGAVVKSGLGSLIGKAIVGGLGSAIGGFGVDQIINKLKGRDIADLTQEEADELERQLSELMASQPASKRELEARISLGPISKGIIGLGTSLGVSTLVGSGLDKLKGLFQRDFDDMTQEEADELERQLSELMAGQPSSKRELEARISLGPVSKGLIGLGTSLGVSTLVGSGLDKLKGLFQREFDDMTQEEADELERQLSELMAGQPVGKRELEARINLGPISKGVIGLATSLGVSTAVGQGLDAVQGLFQREASLNDLD